MLIVKASKDSEAGKMPSKELIEAMGRFNEEMVNAGILLAAEGLQASSQGARVQFSSNGKKTIIDGPFAETKELIAGFWLINVKDKDEAVRWALRSPAPHENQDCHIEIRRVFETADFSPDVLTPEEAAREEKLREELEKKAAKR
jgi:hypothetical protein